MKNERRKIKIFHVSQENNPFYSSHLHLNVVNDANECKVFFYWMKEDESAHNRKSQNPRIPKWEIYFLCLHLTEQLFAQKLFSAEVLDFILYFFKNFFIPLILFYSFAMPEMLLVFHIDDFNFKTQFLFTTKRGNLNKYSVMIFFHVLENFWIVIINFLKFETFYNIFNRNWEKISSWEWLTLMIKIKVRKTPTMTSLNHVEKNEMKFDSKLKEKSFFFFLYRWNIAWKFNNIARISPCVSWVWDLIYLIFTAISHHTTESIIMSLIKDLIFFA